MSTQAKRRSARQRSSGDELDDVQDILSKEDPFGHRLRYLGKRPRHAIAVIVMTAAYVLQPTSLESFTRLLVAFDLAALVYLVMVWTMMSRSTVAAMTSRAKLQDDGKWTVLILGSVSAMAVLFALAFEMHRAKAAVDGNPALHLALGASTIILAWIFMNTQFALHYAHEFYAPDKEGEVEGGLKFPEEDEPDYWDFMYFSLVIGMTFQVSDVQVTERPMRRLVVAHGALAFFFNVVILALVINLAANLI